MSQGHSKVTRFVRLLCQESFQLFPFIIYFGAILPFAFRLCSLLCSKLTATLPPVECPV